jgi:hypothetical protein
MEPLVYFDGIALVLETFNIRRLNGFPDQVNVCFISRLLLGSDRHNDQHSKKQNEYLLHGADFFGMVHKDRYPESKTKNLLS